MKKWALALLFTPLTLWATDNNSFSVDIKGMTCGACVKMVKDKVSKIKGSDNVKISVSVNKAEVDLSSSQLSAEELKLLKSQIKKAIEEAGYEVIKI